MKDAIGNEIVNGDILHVRLDSDSVIAKVVEVTGGMVVDPTTRKIKPESVRILIDITLKCPQPDYPIQFLPMAYKIHNPLKETQEQAKTDEVIENATSKKPIELSPISKFLRRPSDIKEENLNPKK